MSEFLEVAKAKAWDQGSPVINGPSVLGATPGRELLYAIPVRGERPLHFEWKGDIPDGLTLDGEKGFVTGRAPAGRHKVTFIVSNRLGKTEKNFCFEIEQNHLCRTPVLGWGSWNAYLESVTQDIVSRTAERMVSSGLQSRGYSYVNIDSTWQGVRGGKYNSILPNAKFPDMKALVDHIHSLGLHAGIYSTPMVLSWGANNKMFLPGSTGFPLDPAWYHPFFGGCGKTSFEENDAKAFAEWGFDFLKYDWPDCDLFHTERMRDALEKTGRDFILSLCTSCSPARIDGYRKSGANILRAETDTRARWSLIKKIGFTNCDLWSKLVSPGCWFDKDILALGKMQMNELSSENPFAATDGLSRDEAITHFLGWATFPCSVQLSCDLEKMDELTYDLASNEEILKVNQENFAGASECIDEFRKEKNGVLLRHVKIYARDLSDGDRLYSVFNLGEEDENIELPVHASEFGRIRDLLAGKDLSSVKFALPPHGSKAVRMIRKGNRYEAE